MFRGNNNANQNQNQKVNFPSSSLSQNQVVNNNSQNIIPKTNLSSNNVNPKSVLPNPNLNSNVNRSNSKNHYSNDLNLNNIQNANPNILNNLTQAGTEPESTFFNKFLLRNYLS